MDYRKSSQAELKASKKKSGQFLKLFKTVSRPGDYTLGGALSAEYTNPGIVLVPSKTLVPLPLTQLFADEIIKVAKKSPYGKGEMHE